MMPTSASTSPGLASQKAVTMSPFLRVLMSAIGGFSFAWLIGKLCRERRSANASAGNETTLEPIPFGWNQPNGMGLLQQLSPGAHFRSGGTASGSTRSEIALAIDVRKPRASPPHPWKDRRPGTDGPRGLLPGLPDPRRPFRRTGVRGRDLDRHLLPADLPGTHAQIRELPLLRLGRSSPGSGLPPLPALPAGDRARARLLARQLQHRLARAKTDRRGRARRKRGRRRGLRREAGDRRPPAAPAVQPASR